MYSMPSDPERSGEYLQTKLDNNGLDGISEIYKECKELEKVVINYSSYQITNHN